MLLNGVTISTPFRLCSVLLPFSISFRLPLAFKWYHLASVFFVTCNACIAVRRTICTFVSTSIGVTATRLTYASCWLTRVAMPKPYSEYTKQLVVYHHFQGLKLGDISLILQEEGIMASRRGIGKFLAKFIESGSVARKPGSGRPS